MSKTVYYSYSDDDKELTDKQKEQIKEAAHLKIQERTEFTVNSVRFYA